MTDPDLIRLFDAQDQIYQQVLSELAAGRKETHWMWFIFPQLAGLVRSGVEFPFGLNCLQLNSGCLNRLARIEASSFCGYVTLVEIGHVLLS